MLARITRNNLQDSKVFSCAVKFTRHRLGTVMIIPVGGVITKRHFRGKTCKGDRESKGTAIFHAPISSSDLHARERFPLNENNGQFRAPESMVQGRAVGADSLSN